MSSIGSWFGDNYHHSTSQTRQPNQIERNSLSLTAIMRCDVTDSVVLHAEHRRKHCTRHGRMGSLSVLCSTLYRHRRQETRRRGHVHWILKFCVRQRTAFQVKPTGVWGAYDRVPQANRSAEECDTRMNKVSEGGGGRGRGRYCTWWRVASCCAQRQRWNGESDPGSVICGLPPASKHCI